MGLLYFDPSGNIKIYVINTIINENNNIHGECRDKYINTLVNPRPIQFVHIPKTGGSSFENLLVDIGIQYNFSVISENRCWPLSQKTPYFNGVTQTIYYGHRSYGFNYTISQHNILGITILREPIKRITSFYYFSIKEHAWRNCCNMTFDEFITRYRTNTLDNSKRYIFNILSLYSSPILYLNDLAETTCDQYSNEYYSKYISLTAKQKVINAMNTLHKIDVVVTTKTMNNAIKQLWLTDKRFPNSIYNIDLNSMPRNKSIKYPKYLSNANIKWLKLKLSDEYRLYSEATKIEINKTKSAIACYNKHVH